MAKKPVAGLSAGMLQTDAPAEPRQIELESAIAAVPFVDPVKPVTATVKLAQPLYKRLRAYCTDHRTKGQAVTVDALDAFLKSHGY